MDKPGIKVRPVLGQQDRDLFISVPFALYKDDPNWVPPLKLERMIHISPSSNPFFRHAEVQLFIAEKNGVPVGRISAQINRLHLERYGDDTGHFGFLEAPDDPQVFRALLEMAENWLRARGMKRVTGPFSFSINDETGLLITGFDRPPNMMMGHALPYYSGHIEKAGYSKTKDVIAYFLNDTGALPRPMKAAYERAIRSPLLKVRPINKRKLESELDIILSIHTDAWSENWGFVPFTAEEIKDLGNNLKWLIKEEYVAIAEYDGEPAAMAVSLPNINEWIKDLDGRLSPLGVSKLLWRLGTQVPRSIRLVLMGVRKRYHGSLLGSSLALSVIERVRSYHIQRGTVSGELSWVLEDNYPVRHIIEALGADPYKTYRVYEKALD
jgi:GNAT superfamily N-acetyltransferase